MSKNTIRHVFRTSTKRILSYLKRLLPQKRPPAPAVEPDASATKTNTLPPPPRELLRGREIYEIPLLRRRIDRETDTPLAALYRLYEHIMLDQNIEMRNELESFWFQPHWPVHAIPDPHDPDPERYAVLAVIPALLVSAFNKRIDLGLPRDAQPIFTMDQFDEWRAGERERERVPEWTKGVAGCEQVLRIPHWDNEVRDFVTIDGFDDERASREFAEKNVLVW
jgi:hypothetical protein